MPTTPTRYLIFEQVVQRLGEIVAGVDYWTSPTVQRLEPPDPDSGDSGPWIVVSFGPENPGEPSVGGRYNSSLTINIDGYVQKSSSAATTVDSACKLLQDIRKAILSNIAAIKEDVAECLYVWLADEDTDEGILDYGGGLVRVRQPIVVVYKTGTEWM